MQTKHRLFAAVAVAAVLFAGARPGLAQEPATPNPNLVELEPKLRLFFDTLSSGPAQTQTAFQELLRGSQLAQQTAAVETLVTKAAALPEQYGAIRGYERIEAKSYGADLMRLRYLYKCESYPVIWTFWYYRPPARTDTTPAATTPAATWRVISVRFDNDLRVLEMGG